MPEPLSASDSAPYGPAYPSIWLNPSQYGNTDVVALYAWRRRFNWIRWCSEDSVASEEEVKLLAKGIDEFEREGLKSKNEETQPQLVQHWEKSKAEFDTLWNKMEYPGMNVNVIMQFIQNLHAMVGAKVESKLRQWLGTAVGTDAKKRKMYEDVTHVWAREIDDRDGSWGGRTAKRVWNSTWGKCNSFRDTTFNTLMLFVRSPAMFYPLTLAFQHIKRYICAEVTKVLGPWFDMYVFTDSPDTDYVSKREANTWEISRALLLSLSGQTGNEGWMASILHQMDTGMRLASSGLKMGMGVVGLSSFADAATSGLSAIFEQAFMSEIHKNVQQLQMYYGTKTLVNLISEPCLENVKIAGVRVIVRPENKSMRDCMRDWFWSINPDPDLNALAQTNFPQYVESTMQYSALAGMAGGAAIGLTATFFSGGTLGIAALGAGAMAGAGVGGGVGAGAGYASAVFYGKGPSGTYTDIQQLARDVSTGVVDMFEVEEKKQMFVMWSEFESRDANVEVAQRYFIKFLKQHITELMHKERAPLDPLPPVSVMYLTDLMKDSDRDFDDTIAQRLKHDREMQKYLQDPFATMKQVYTKQKENAQEAKIANASIPVAAPPHLD